MNVALEPEINVDQTPGEKLFLSHLSSYSKDDDNPEEKQSTDEKHGENGERKNRSISIGEELWIVHCKRAIGMAFESDVDTNKTVETKKKLSARPPQKAVKSNRVIALRSRRVEIR